MCYRYGITFDKDDKPMTDLFINNKSAVVLSNRVLYTPSTFARTTLLYLQEIGELTAKSRHTSSRFGLASFLFFTVVSGTGALVYDGKEYKLKPFDCVFIDCEKPYSHTTDAENLWTLRWIHFNGSVAAKIYEKYKERGGRPVFCPANMQPFADTWQKLFSLASSDDYIRDMRINEGLGTLLTLIMENSWHPEEKENMPKKKSLVISVKYYLDHNYSSKITLDGLSAYFFIDKYYLTKKFKEQYGQSINNYLLNLRITKAKQMLRFSDKSIEEIGLECGLGLPHYFSAKFKEIEGVPPSVYRENW